MEASARVIRYHEDSKHRPERYARSLGYLDWATQPDPFRRFDGSRCIHLPLSSDDLSPTFGSLPEWLPSSAPVTAFHLGCLFEYALGLTAWKEYKGSRWALRSNPSSGNLHPTEGYLVAPALEDLSAMPGVYHYAPCAHAMEQRATLDDACWEPLAVQIPEGAFLVGLATVYWREAWKYGERAYRYCQHDLGHALAALAYSAAALGWSVQWCSSVSDLEMAALLGLDRSEDFHEGECDAPGLLAVVAPNSPAEPLDLRISADLLNQIRSQTWTGRANRLSKSHVPWDAIAEVAAACEKPRTAVLDGAHEPATTVPTFTPCKRSSWALYKARRSAVAMDATTALPLAAFLDLLAATLPDRALPWSALGSPVTTHLLLFVHRVEGLTPGLYAFPRDRHAEITLRRQTQAVYDWQPVADAPEGLPLFKLRPGDCRALAAMISCQQDIAADGAFSLAMLATFEESLATQGPWFYRRLYWETGMLGQVLYLHAHAVGTGATGIGCYFDDMAHEVGGLDGRAFQSLYHFTIGQPVEDDRLTTLPAYDAARRSRP